MKKLLSIVIVLILAFSCAFSVSADVIFEPDDDFYESHRSECVLVERNFIATETVYTVNEPCSEVVYGKINEGDKVYISYTYKDKDGIVWGLISFSEVSGWVPMGYLEVVYDNISFTEEFGDEFNTDTDELKLPNRLIAKLVFWEYPGSESCYEMELWDDSYTDIHFSHSYTDKNGTVWGYVGYFYGNRGWVCIDAPASVDAAEILEREPQVLYPDSVLDDDSTVEKGGTPPIWTAVILVVAVCAVTAVIIVIFIRKKKA